MALTPFNFMSYLTEQAINQGVPRETIVLILIFPIIATIIAFVRHVVGLRTLGVYIPSILAISFIATGIKIGLIFFILILGLGTLVRILLIKLKLLYLPRIALILTFISLLTFFMIIIASQLDIPKITQMSIFPMLVMVILVERFLNVQIERGFNDAILLTLETLLFSIGCYFLMISSSFQNFIINYPGIILLVIIFNFLIGRWTGLRLTEYFRFREIVKPK